MPVAFPALRPTEREYLPPEHAVTSLRSQSGVVSKRLWGSQPSNAELILRFNNITSDRAAAVVNAWTATRSGIDYLTFPVDPTDPARVRLLILSGSSAALQSVVFPTNGTLRWTFAERPAVTSVGPAWASVRVRLVGELRLN
jgi:hypothetical protein